MFALTRPAFWIHFFTQFHCYYCGSEQGYSSRRRNVFESSLLPWFFLRPVRCGDCSRRFYVPVSVPVRHRGYAVNSITEDTVSSLISRQKEGSEKQIPDSTEPPKRIA